jgi:hypothetical protein
VDLLCLYRPVFQSVDPNTQSTILKQAYICGVSCQELHFLIKTEHHVCQGRRKLFRSQSFIIPPASSAFGDVMPISVPFHSFSIMVPHHISIIYEFREHSRAVRYNDNDMDTYSGGARFESRSFHPLSWFWFFVILLSSYRQFHPVPRLRIVELYLHTPEHLMMWCLIN